jgi:hypothetical protein
VGQQRYASFRVHLSMLDRVHVYGMLIDVPGFPRRLILARTAVIKGMIKRGNGKHWNFYIPLRDDRPSVPAPSQRTDIRKFVDAWWTFDV